MYVKTIVKMIASVRVKYSSTMCSPNAHLASRIGIKLWKNENENKRPIGGEDTSRASCGFIYSKSRARIRRVLISPRHACPIATDIRGSSARLSSAEIIRELLANNATGCIAAWKPVIQRKCCRQNDAAAAAAAATAAAAAAAPFTRSRCY